MPRCYVRPLLCLGLGAVVIACDSDDDPTSPGEPSRIEIVSGAPATGTAYAFLPEPLVVRIYDDGQPRAYATVRVDSSPLGSLQVSDQENDPYGGDWGYFSADENGRLTLWVRLGPPGTARLVVSALGRKDSSAVYTILPGSPASGRATR